MYIAFYYCVSFKEFTCKCIMSLTPNKKRNVDDSDSVPSSSMKNDDSLIHITPPKIAKLEGDGSAGQSPSPSRLHYQMNALEAALSHYFSPKKRSPGRSPGRPTQRNLQFVSTFESSEEEEENLRPKSCTKSDSCNFDAVKQCFEELDDYLPAEVKECPNEKICENNFIQWAHFLDSGEFSILLHGLGSKRQILGHFRDFLLSHSRRTFVGDGLNASETLPKMIERMADELDLNGTTKTKQKSVEAMAKALRKAIDEQLTGSVVFIMFNIDSHHLRSRDRQKALSLLAKSRKIQLIASVDHVNAALIWDQSLRDAFVWLHFPVSTFHCYQDEVLSNGTGLLGLDEKGIAKHTISSLDAFWGATTSNARKILAQLALHAPSKKDRGRMGILSIPKFCRILKEQFATTSETVLSQQLVEFCDHRLIQLDKEGHIQLMVERQLLSTFLDSKLASDENGIQLI